MRNPLRAGKAVPADIAKPSTVQDMLMARTLSDRLRKEGFVGIASVEAAQSFD